ncbi:hypothetical protein F5876DRAFT_82256 [Lentinula aff. lateritia]|uniref:Uncharacterized protein n=1 Tax=Lentinula aff. lateritia TaxID=2804960 RepID=A0ACC1TKC5_9AGAR|nr:hypothetical protein F5876DRAFT_82256 [Lentinula aff. lateritia]
MFFQQKHEEANLKLTQKEQELTAKVNKSNMIQTNFEEINNLQKEKSKLDSDIKDFQPAADGNLSDQVAVLQHDNLMKSLEIQRLEQEFQASMSNTGCCSGQASASSTPATPLSHHSVPVSSSQSSTSTLFREPPPLSQSTAYPINGDIIHNIFAVGGLGTMLLRVPVAAGLSHVRHSYPQCSPNIHRFGEPTSPKPPRAPRLLHKLWDLKLGNVEATHYVKLRVASTERPPSSKLESRKQKSALSHGNTTQAQKSNQAASTTAITVVAGQHLMSIPEQLFGDEPSSNVRTPEGR